MSIESSRLGWTERCCICGANVVSYNNPDPIRDGTQNCCNECNLLVRAARIRIFRTPEQERQQYIDQLQKMSWEELKDELSNDVG